MAEKETLEELQNRVMRHFQITVDGSLEATDELKEKLNKIKLTSVPASEFKKFEANYVYTSPFAYELDGSYQAITEHPEVVTYTTSTDTMETVAHSKSVDTSNYVLKDVKKIPEAINRLGYFEELMKKYKIKDIAELELMIESYIDERGEY